MEEKNDIKAYYLVKTKEEKRMVIHMFLVELAKEINEASHAKGSYLDERYILGAIADSPLMAKEEKYRLSARLQKMYLGEQIALMHTELSEAMDVIRKNINIEDKNCPDFKAIEIEFVDLLIRVLGTMFENNMDIGGALFAKMDYNLTRDFWKEGKEF